MKTSLFIAMATSAMLFGQMSMADDVKAVVNLKDGSALSITSEQVDKTVAVKGNPQAARLSERLNFEKTLFQSVADSAKGLTLNLAAVEGKVAAGGSYTRYHLTLSNTSDKPIALDKIKFAEGEVSGDLANGQLRKVGNTDGCVIVCQTKDPEVSHWFAIEHPMARYDLNAGNPAGVRQVARREAYTIQVLTNKDNGRGDFEVPVEVTSDSLAVKFQYTGGNLRAIFYKVEAIDPATGEVLACDQHEGTTGGVSSQNVYYLTGLPVGKKLVLRVQSGTDGAGTSNGSISLNGASFADQVEVNVKASPSSLQAYVPIADELAPGASMTLSCVYGTCLEASQFRRVFNQYLNAERAHPHRVLPHYNSWYDLGINRNDRQVSERFTEAEALASMRAFREELWEKRGVFINSYLWDDGWDEWNSFWGFNSNFPKGFSNLSAEAKKVKGASIGCWLSPFGGYGGSFSRRLAYAKREGFVDQNASGLQLAKPMYYAAFRDRVLQMIRDYDMNLFKFDRMGSGGDANGAADRYAPDLRAVGNLCAEMRAAKQDVFINCTVGTWASPYWLMWCDSIWKGGDDCDGLGSVGTARQRWVTYRDNIIHDRFASKSPLFPLNSMMMHGIIVCKSSPHNTMRDYRGTGSFMYKGEGYATPTACVDFAAEVWMGMALGTGLQEYYITPDFMSEVWWDILANGVKWLKANESVLMDSHWIGGDPGSGHDMAKRGNEPKDIYGYASLGEEKGIVILRNPAATSQKITVDLIDWLELPKVMQQASCESKVVFNSTAEYENANSDKSFNPTWPQSVNEKIVWELPPFTTFLFEVNLKK